MQYHIYFALADKIPDVVTAQTINDKNAVYTMLIIYRYYFINHLPGTLTVLPNNHAKQLPYWMNCIICFGPVINDLWLNNSSGVSHSDGSCVLGRIHSDVSSNIPKKVYHIVTDNFVNLLHISYAWLYKTECWERKFHAFSFNSHRNCKIFMTNFNFIFDTICVPYIIRKSIFGWNCDHDTPLCDTPLLEDTPLCDTPDELIFSAHNGSVQIFRNE